MMPPVAIPQFLALCSILVINGNVVRCRSLFWRMRLVSATLLVASFLSLFTRERINPASMLAKMGLRQEEGFVRDKESL
jgi:hypothetical protein